MFERARIMPNATWFLTVMIATTLGSTGLARAENKEKDKDYELRDEPRDDPRERRDEARSLPPAVLRAARKYAAGLEVEDVKTREVKGHPKVFVIEGESEGRDVVLHVTEGGAVQEARFHDRPAGVKPLKQAHSSEELPNAVRETALRIFPEMEVREVKSHQFPHEERVYHVGGKTVEDGQEREVVLVIEADGDLLEARVFKPRLAKAAEADEENRPDEENRKEKNKDKDTSDD